MTTDLSPELLAYFEARQRQRDEEIAAAFAQLDKKRNKRLIREAAVMGFVQGHRYAGGRPEDFPSDAEILRAVLEGGKTFPDTFRRLAALFDGEVSR